jgi:hypothetical protein
MRNQSPLVANQNDLFMQFFATSIKKCKKKVVCDNLLVHTLSWLDPLASVLGVSTGDVSY